MNQDKNRLTRIDQEFCHSNVNKFTINSADHRSFYKIYNL
jgi:hypothetical protein